MRWLALALITALAAALRLVDLGAVRLDPFYDAAVRSMGLSWHNFFFGAYEPGGSVSIDKPPVDLWLQVASVKLFGWGSASLKLPEALAGHAVGAAAVRRRASARSASSPGCGGARAGGAADRGDHRAQRHDGRGHDAAARAGAAAAGARLRDAASTVWLLAARGGARPGVQREAVRVARGAAGPARARLAGPARTGAGHDAAHAAARRAAKLAAAAAVYVVVALSWLGATLLFPAHERPYAIGSTNGSAWNAAFVFNGSERLSGKTAKSASRSTRASPVVVAANRQPRPGTPITPPSPTRLLARSGQLPAKWLGWEALVALLLGIAVVISVLRARARRVQRAMAIGVFVWLLTGLVLFSAMARLHPRYVESFTPAVAAMFGIGVGVARRHCTAARACSRCR